MRRDEKLYKICKRCTGRDEAHYLTCPTLRRPFRFLRNVQVTVRAADAGQARRA